MDTVAGVWFPRGGMRAVGRALAEAAEAAGARIHYGRTVTGLQQRDGRVTAVRHRASAEPAADSEAHAVRRRRAHPRPARSSYALLGRAPRRPVPLR